MGPDWYAGPLQDWDIREGRACASPRGPAARFAHVATKQLADPTAGFVIETTVHIDPNVSRGREKTAGIVIGVRGNPDNLLHAVVYPEHSFLAGLTADGGIVLGTEYQKLSPAPAGPVQLVLRGSASDGGKVRLHLTANDTNGRRCGSLTTEEPGEAIRGAIGLHVRSGRKNEPSDPDPSEFARFSDVQTTGDAFQSHPENRFGPILWTQYSYAGSMLKVQAQFPPLEPEDASHAALQFRDESGKWRTVTTAAIEPASSTALFEIDSWDAREDVDYRVVYEHLGTESSWSGVIRKEPSPNRPWTLGLFSCDHGDLFPLRELLVEVRRRDPDMLFFAGDQFYEGFGGFGMVREPLAIARLDYLRKWFLFGWTNRDLLKDRPSIIVPDDHDVFQGNLWGQGGRELPGMSTPKQRRAPFARGGYAMAPDWIHIAQRCQTGHLPPAFDPTPVEQKIGVYYTGFSFGGVSFAVVEDRKFKIGPQSEQATAGSDTLLGVRQLRFLESWAEDWRDDATMKIVLSQTLFAQGATHIGGQLRRAEETPDSNSWPVAGRNRAVAAIRKAAAFSLHGDQHLALQVRHGIDDWNDAGVAFMGPATCAGFARAWWPDTQTSSQSPVGSLPSEAYTGKFHDDYGHPLTVHAVANPVPVSQWENGDPVKLAMAKASGYAMIGVDPTQQTMTVNCYPLPYQIDTDRLDGDQYAGWPLTFSINDNDGRDPIGFLPKQRFDIDRPVIGVYHAEGGELIYARRILERDFQPPVYEPGRYELRVGKDSPADSVGVFEVGE